MNVWYDCDVCLVPWSREEPMLLLGPVPPPLCPRCGTNCDKDVRDLERLRREADEPDRIAAAAVNQPNNDAS